MHGSVLIDADYAAELAERKRAKNQRKRTKQQRNREVRARLWQEWKDNGAVVVTTDQ